MNYVIAQDASEPYLEILSKDHNPAVRRAVIYNPNVTFKLLEYLSNDVDNFVSNCAKKRLRLRYPDGKPDYVIRNGLFVEIANLSDPFESNDGI